MTTPEATPRRTLWSFAPWLVVAALAVAVVLGARALWFSCDDAFITFRYVANAKAGHGLVWNPEPFAPVEGYTSFSWAMVLWAVWSWFGVAPPAAANVLSTICGVLTFFVLAVAALRLRRRDGARVPAVVGLSALAVVAANRTFLQWFSSGLETALFNLPFVAWVLLGFVGRERRGTGWLATWSAAAALAALTRPDGLLAVAATGGVAVLAAVSGERSVRRTALGLVPLLAVAAHVAWRRSYYGEWLPNTYYAKVAGGWPGAGERYFTCFAIENGAWLWLLILCASLIAFVLPKRSGRDGGGSGGDGGSGPLAAALARLPALAVVAGVLFHTGFYLFKIGGDHFEYRVLSQLVPLGVLGSIAAVAYWSRGVLAPLATAAALLLAGSVGWVHYALTKDPAFHGVRALAPHLPAFAQPLARHFDRQQAWLFFRYIGLRCNHHALQLERWASDLPPRHQFTPDQSADPFPIAPADAAGMIGWVLPDCCLIDVFGLNDWVVARAPRPPLGEPPPDLDASTVDVDGDGRLDRAEFKALVAPRLGSIAGSAAAEYVLVYLMSLADSDRADRIPVAEAELVGELIDTRRLMAHECRPPAGYVAAFAPNVTVFRDRVVIAPRETPMTAERIRELEREWRQRVLQLPAAR